MKDPTRSKNAVLEPSWMAPKAVQRIAIGIWFSYLLQMARRRIARTKELRTTENRRRNRTTQLFINK